MVRSISILLISILFFACGAKKKMMEDSAKPKSTTSIKKDSVNIYIITYIKNYSPLEIEESVTKPLEAILLPINSVVNIKSTSEEEYSKISVVFTSISKEKALQTVQSKVNELRKNNGLPIINNPDSNPLISDKKSILDKKFTTQVPTVIRETDGYITDDGVSVTVETVTPKPIEAFNHTVLNGLLQKYVSPEGNVDYKGFQKDRTTLRNYIASLGENMPTDTWTKEDKLAYWINAYNALTVDLILRNYPTNSIKDIKNPWKQRLWKLGEKWYNLDEIEHKILRKMDEPRIHFAINCASFSCPPLLNEAYTASTLEQQLTQVTKAFLADTKRNTITSNNIVISKIFQWFAKDFKKDGSLIDFLNRYSDVQISPKAKKSYKKYDWNLNE